MHPSAPRAFQSIQSIRECALRPKGSTEHYLARFTRGSLSCFQHLAITKAPRALPARSPARFARFYSLTLTGGMSCAARLRLSYVHTLLYATLAATVADVG